MKLTIQLRFYTRFGQTLFISGNHPLLGNNNPEQALPMHYGGKDYWEIQLHIAPLEVPVSDIEYHFLLRDADGTWYEDWGEGRKLRFQEWKTEDLLVTDTWNNASFYLNAFYTEPFREVLLQSKPGAVAAKTIKSSHLFRVRYPLLPKGQVLCLLGSSLIMGSWDTAQPLLMREPKADGYWELPLYLLNGDFPITYKYGIYDTAGKRFVRFEDGENRVLYASGTADSLVVVNDGFAHLPDTSWKGAGVAIPVFSLRSKTSMGCGDFTDLKQLTNWAVRTGLRLIQILPVNDTTATYKWTDCYPYAAISAFALHPVYLNLYDVAGDENAAVVKAAAKEKKRLEALDVLDYEAVIQLKMDLSKQLYELQGKKTAASSDYKAFFAANAHWLVPYARFSYLRDKYGSAHFSGWPEHSAYDEQELEALSKKPAVKKQLGFYYFLQYHLHKQLREAAAYAHSKGIILKGDIAIGIYRDSVDAWQQPSQYHMNLQAGAPPDDFAVKGQNWGFPTYNWEKMQQDGFAWWKQRLAQMGHYFDAFRIDHILGFFRIWSIPQHAVEGILGYFVPALPVYGHEFEERGIWFDHKRYTRPYITAALLDTLFGEEARKVAKAFLEEDGKEGLYKLKPAFATQRQVEAHFAGADATDMHALKLRQGLYDLISNVILLEVAGMEGQFHFRFDMQDTYSFQQLDMDTQWKLKQLYNNYFFERQDAFWKREAMQKLPVLKKVTDMLICGEDLGLVPASVPDVMKQLGLLSLEVQRMPKDPRTAFFRPYRAPYLSVVTPSTHDMSTIRGWWEEDRAITQHFYNEELQHTGEAPLVCDAWINKEIVNQHLQSPAMWSIFQLQDLLGIDAAIRRRNAAEERINIPANPRHYWQYRMHLTLEKLLKESDFNTTLQNMVKAAGR
ncbi:4-alpha-glucanotransferase [Filimonas effusa]|uniref:4-alpha-glucanotransferase n=1 Tax=Filimonas effusa TaxID=2508721 RepID=A0A4Q1D8G3_9BACT|nr:4-alpha-glucanotransferase [Filimonas effusa]RXK85627.1 4-alpha-glucanotransferase [Filimonas effusa]